MGVAKQVASFGAFHQGKVTNLKILEEGSHFVSSSCDGDKKGSLCCWSLAGGNMIWRKVFSLPQVTMDAYTSMDKKKIQLSFLGRESTWKVSSKWPSAWMECTSLLWEETARCSS
mmetsp:Transcript_3499/g.5917  ORF Transcript_3499/g.5917 Transcript_3499/m.5917 type:complete len:115 (+) Transcript_3499:577-921(+)